MGRTTDVSNDSGGLHYPVSMLSGILPSNWRRYTVPTGLTVLQWVADFSDRVKQLQKISHAANTGGAKGLKVCYYRTGKSKIFRGVNIIFQFSGTFRGDVLSYAKRPFFPFVFVTVSFFFPEKNHLLFK